jgi:hypothetical protein
MSGVVCQRFVLVRFRDSRDELQFDALYREVAFAESCLERRHRILTVITYRRLGTLYWLVVSRGERLSPASVLGLFLSHRTYCFCNLRFP